MTLAALIASSTIGETWQQGRTAYGGASAALALAAAQASRPDLPPLRSVQVAFVGPLAGNVTATPTLLRRGKNSAFIGVDVAGEAGIGLRALFLFMASRPSAIAHLDLPAPDAPLDETALIDPARLPQPFMRNLDVLPWQRDGATTRSWRRLKERDGLDPEIELLAVADALPPAAMNFAREWGPISTTTWQLNLLSDRATTRDGWWLLEAKALQAADGASSQNMTIWDRDGAPVATATQSVAIFV